MFDMSWGEVLVIGGVALIVIGPKDLPRALRTVGQVTGKIRRMAAEFQGQFQEAMREAELDDVKQQLQGMNDSVSSMNKGFNPIQTIRDELKTAVEAPVTATDKAPSDAVAETTAAGAPAPEEPIAELPVPSLPPLEDPAELIAESLRREAEAAKQAAAPAPSQEKPDAIT
ncbi:Sec-independent protein translocase protein TatB [Microvirga alba]|uniref:Sec-independent protein translocase protein TatB n=1 Tax=Microvirga alba TaxID=2791025 RepID=A0A931BJJ7_9HYPH|nr:Sec-independent protein translocase protein TatB [Microvirga alba]MBF9232381.1 twin-arginine translocase subunit TatB [Microvirga alba]